MKTLNFCVIYFYIGKGVYSVLSVQLEERQHFRYEDDDDDGSIHRKEQLEYAVFNYVE